MCIQRSAFSSIQIKPGWVLRFYKLHPLLGSGCNIERHRANASRQRPKREFYEQSRRAGIAFGLQSFRRLICRKQGWTFAKNFIWSLIWTFFEEFVVDFHSRTENKFTYFKIKSYINVLHVFLCIHTPPGRTIRVESTPFRLLHVYRVVSPPPISVPPIPITTIFRPTFPWDIS